MSFLLKSTWTNLFYLLQEHLQSWLDDLQMPAELSHNVLQGILQNHVLKVEVLSAKTLFMFFFKKNCLCTLTKLLFLAQLLRSRSLLTPS